jgi:hypothetical protein
MSFRTIAIVAILFLSIWQPASAQSGEETNALVSCSDGVRGRQYNETGAQMDGHKSIHAVGQSQAKARSHARAEAKITVQSSEAEPYDQTSSPALMELRLSETFTGDIDGESPVRALQVLRDDHSACLVSMQRFRGKLGSRQGTFVLQGSEIVENGNIRTTWFVVPGSGTGDLSGLRGEGGFEGQFGKGSDGTLDYWFE